MCLLVLSLGKAPCAVETVSIPHKHQKTRNYTRTHTSVWVCQRGQDESRRGSYLGQAVLGFDLQEWGGWGLGGPPGGAASIHLSLLLDTAQLWWEAVHCLWHHKQPDTPGDQRDWVVTENLEAYMSFSCSCYIQYLVMWTQRVWPVTIWQDFLPVLRSFLYITAFYWELVFILVSAVLEWPGEEEEAIFLVQEEIVVLIKFEQVEAGERNFFVSLFLAVRETYLQGVFWNLATLNREYP